MHWPRSAQHRCEHVRAQPVWQSVDNCHTADGACQAHAVEVDEAATEVLEPITPCLPELPPREEVCVAARLDTLEIGVGDVTAVVLGADPEVGEVGKGAGEGVHPEGEVVQLYRELAHVGVDRPREDGLARCVPRDALQLLEGGSEVGEEPRRVVFFPLVKVQVIENPFVGVAEKVNACGDEGGPKCRQQLAGNASSAVKLDVSQAGEPCERGEERRVRFEDLFHAIKPQMLDVDQKWNGFGKLSSKIQLRIACPEFQLPEMSTTG